MLAERGNIAARRADTRNVSEVFQERLLCPPQTSARGKSSQHIGNMLASAMLPPQCPHSVDSRPLSSSAILKLFRIISALAVVCVCVCGCLSCSFWSRRRRRRMVRFQDSTTMDAPAKRNDKRERAERNGLENEELDACMDAVQMTKGRNLCPPKRKFNSEN